MGLPDWLFSMGKTILYCAQVWNEMSDEDKRPYYEEAERIKHKHKRDYPGTWLGYSVTAHNNSVSQYETAILT